jgi:hypothetical protein
LFGEVNGIDRAEVNAYTASFTGDRVNCKRGFAGLITIHSDGIEPTSRQTGSASNTVLLADSRLLAATECTTVLYAGLKDKMQVSGIHVAVRKNLVFRKHGERRNDAGFASAALAAYDNDLFHMRVVIPFTCASNPLKSPA